MMLVSLLFEDEICRDKVHFFFASMMLLAATVNFYCVIFFMCAPKFASLRPLFYQIK